MQMLKKLSLAALVAMGSMSFAGATDLSSAIQGVQLNGYLRVRAYYDAKHTPDKANPEGNSYRRWRTNAKLVFGVPVAESTKIVWRVHSQTDLYNTGDDTVYKGKKPTVDENGNVISVDKSKTSKTGLTDSLFFVNYKKDAIAANIGVVPLGFLPYASSDSWGTAHGAGATATYTTGDITLAAGYVDRMFNSEVDNDDVYTAGAIYKNKEIGSAQFWYFKVDHAVNNGLVLMTNLNVVKGVSVAFDVAQAKKDEKDAKTKPQVHRYYNLALNAKVSGISAKVGAAKTNDRAGIINTSVDSKIGNTVGELRHNIANETDAKSLYAKLGYDVTEAAKVFVAYNNISQNQDTKKTRNGDSNEYEVGAKYKVNKKFGISGYYDVLNMSNDLKTDKQEARVEFKYSF
jgi:hypothetical protein